MVVWVESCRADGTEAGSGGHMTRSSLLVCVLLGLLPDPASSQNFELMYQQACAGGELVSCNVLGLMYLTGEGVTRDPARALPLYMRGCDGGLSGACINLGVMYQTGEGVTQNLARAAELYERACSSGDLTGCDNLLVLDPSDVILLDPTVGGPRGGSSVASWTNKPQTVVFQTWRSQCWAPGRPVP
ncbi:MAG TPA: sel1 repeat family protein [Gemmatimonadetes bacterium]|nr:sel1 repeat family protein [Gemmatimonadota bacterium]